MAIKSKDTTKKQVIDLTGPDGNAFYLRKQLSKKLGVRPNNLVFGNGSNEIIEFVASQPWCNGKVGMVGCSYFGMSQLLAAEHQPEGLAAIFPYDAATDLYRDAYYHGGIYSAWARFWFTSLMFLNHTGGRVADLSGFDEASVRIGEPVTQASAP